MKVYADNAATTKLCDEAYEAMIPLLKDHYANPSGVYSEGVFARGAINEARHTIAESLGAYEKEILFTAGGSEADNLALIGVMEACKDKGRHLITTNIEHHAILESCKYLEQHGFRVTYIPANKEGLVNSADIEAAITDDTVLISVMYANNELGTIQPIEKIGEIAKAHNVLFHTDAVQAYGKILIKPDLLNVDLLSASAHKFNGPKGAGFLYIKRGTPINSLIHGGSQEYRLRGGTENVPAIAGMGAAAKVAVSKLQERWDYEKNLSEYLIGKISEIDGLTFNGNAKYKLPGIINATVDGVEGDSLLITLDMKGIAASAGSACAQSLEAPSHVLMAIGKSDTEARSSIRLSISHENTFDEMDYLAEMLKENIAYLRRIRA